MPANVSYDGPLDSTKQAYGHTFVPLAASSAKVAGFPDGDRLITDISTIIVERFWEEQFGAGAEEFAHDWQAFDHYRGKNSNMRLTESLMVAFDTRFYLLAHGGTNSRFHRRPPCGSQRLADSRTVY